MKAWHFKLLKDSARAFLPFRNQLRALKRKIIPYQSNPHNDEYLFSEALDIVVELKGLNAKLDGTIVEIGSGWIPIIPMLFHANGASTVICCDVERLMDEETVEYAKNYIESRIEDASNALGLDKATIQERLDCFELNYKCPFDPAQLGEASADVVYSRNVLEHIPPPDLTKLFSEIHRILTPEGVTLHHVDHSDHWEHNDKSISRVNFLKYGDTAWSVTSINNQNYQNRLRSSDYETLLSESPLCLFLSAGVPDPKALKDVASMKLAPRFREKSLEDLAILTSRFAASKTPRSGLKPR